MHRVATHAFRRFCRHALPFLAIAVSATTLVAQGTAHDTIVVVDGRGQPVPFANVSIKGGFAQVTDEHGVLLLRAKDDTLNLLVRRLGFEPYQGHTGRATPGGAFHVTLSRATQTLNKVVVSETMSAEPLRRNGFYERMMDVKKGAQVEFNRRGPLLRTTPRT